MLQATIIKNDHDGIFKLAREKGIVSPLSNSLAIMSFFAIIMVQQWIGSRRAYTDRARGKWRLKRRLLFFAFPPSSSAWCLRLVIVMMMVDGALSLSIFYCSKSKSLFRSSYVWLFILCENECVMCGLWCCLFARSFLSFTSSVERGLRFWDEF